MSNEVSQDHIVEGVKNVLAKLCAEAPTNNVRDCLRQYSYDKPVEQAKKAINRYSKDVIIETLEYLGIKKQWRQYNKPLCLKDLLTRIKSLLPTSCELCRECYFVSKDEVSLLSCQRCGQGIHQECLMQILGDKYDSNMSQEDVMSVLNPMSFLGFYYLCGECSGSMMTADAELKSKTSKPKVHVLEDNDVNIEEETEESDDDDDHHHLEIHDENGDLIDSQPFSKKNESCCSGTGFRVVGKDADILTNKLTMCRYYKKGNCKHGRKEDGCKFDHPKACRKLMQHGNKGPRGCNEGTNCKDFHPRMCSESITKGECHSNRCTFAHVKGTKRNKKEEKKEETRKKVEGNGSGLDERKDVPDKNKVDKSKDFLDLVHNFKREIMEVMDTKLNMVMMSLMPPKMNFQTMPMFPVRPTETNATMAMPWMGMQQSQQGKMQEKMY